MQRKRPASRLRSGFAGPLLLLLLPFFVIGIVAIPYIASRSLIATAPVPALAATRPPLVEAAPAARVDVFEPYPSPIILPRNGVPLGSLRDALSNKLAHWWFRAAERTSVAAQPEDALTTCAAVDLVPSTPFPVCLPFLPLGLDDHCVAYAFHDAVSFEFELLLLHLGCEVHYFGSSPGVPTGIVAHRSVARPALAEIMASLGHGHVAVLRASCADECAAALLQASGAVGVIYIEPSSPASELALNDAVVALVGDRGGFALWFVQPLGARTLACFVNQRMSALLVEAAARQARARAHAGTILYLGSPGTSSSYGAKDHRGDKLTQSLTLLNTHYNARARNDVLVLYTLDRPFTREHQRALAALHPPGCVRFRPLAGAWWSPPPHVDVRTHKAWRRPAFSVGYRSMCRFFAVLIWDYLDALGYAFVWRLDDDSFIHSRVEPPDVFAHMRTRGCNYGFRVGTYDNNDRDDFFVFVDKYLADNGALAGSHGNFSDGTKSRRTRDVGPDYYTNFFLARVGFFRESRVRAFLDHVDRSGHIFYKRWGDLPIQSVTVHLFSHPEQICYLDQFTYEHISLQGGSCPSSGIMQRGALVGDAEWTALVDAKWAALNCEACGGAEKGSFRNDKYFGPLWSTTANLKRFDGADPGTVRGMLWPRMRP